MMRYWFEGVDEGLEREVERRKKLGLPPPDTDPSFCHFLVFVLSLPGVRAGGRASYIVARHGRRALGLAA